MLRPSAEGSRVLSPTHGHAHMLWFSVPLSEQLPLHQTDGKSGSLFLMLLTLEAQINEWFSEYQLLISARNKKRRLRVWV